MLIIFNINRSVLKLSKFGFRPDRQSFVKSNQIWHDLSNRDKFSQGPTANAAVSDSVAADSADNHSVDIGLQRSENDRKRDRNSPGSVSWDLGQPLLFFFFFSPSFIVLLHHNCWKYQVCGHFFFFLFVLERVLKVLEFSIQNRHIARKNKKTFCTEQHRQITLVNAVSLSEWTDRSSGHRRLWWHFWC